MYEDYARIRDSKGYSDYAVSKGTGISAGTLSDWKKGRYNLKADKLVKIAEFLDVSVDSLMGVQTNVHPNGYYINESTAKMAQELFDNPEMRVLFDAARDSRPEDLRMAADMLLRFKETNRDE